MNLAFRHVPAHLTNTIRAYRELPQFRNRLVANWSLSFQPRYMAVSSDNQMFVRDWDNDCVHVFSADGAFLRKWGSRGNAAGQFDGPHGIAVAKDGQVVVVDCNNHRVQVFAPDGTFLRMWGSEGTGDGQFTCPHGVAVTPSGAEVVVTEYGDRVQVFRLSDGAFVRKWGSRGSTDGQFDNPVAVCVTSTEMVCIAGGFILNCVLHRHRCSWLTYTTTVCRCFLSAARSFASGACTAGTPAG